MKYVLLYTVLFLLTLGNSSAQSLDRGIGLLDLTIQNGEDNDGQLFSAEHILKVTGLPYTITNQPLEAMKYAMVFCSSYLDSQTLTDEEKTNLRNYVSLGGILIAPRVIDDELNALFGISGSTESNSNYSLTWNNTLSTSVFRWINEPEEWTISLGREGAGAMYKTNSYALSTATELAKFDNGLVAVAQNQYGIGYAYTFGFTWKEVILRSLINRDIEAQRISSNGFEPSMDVIMLMMRSIFIEHIPFALWKHTSPNNSTSTLMITHDVDGTSGMDTMNVFSESEKNRGITATYNITVRYISDALESAFYIGKQTQIQKLINDGHVIGSHSVGHFPDFWDDAIFPMGSSGNTKANYLPSNDGTITAGGTVYGEMEVSKNVLEDDFNQAIRIYRTGHLVYNKYMVEVMDNLSYLYNSSYSANEVLTNFPYQNKTNRSFSGSISAIYELPVSISDVYHDDPFSEDNYVEKVDLWLDIISKIDANNASTVLLIHPNREYKIAGQELLLDNLPKSIAIKEMGAYGDYWKARESFQFSSQLTNNNLQIAMADDDLMQNSEISFIINDGQNLDNVLVHSVGNIPIDFDAETWGLNDLILYNFKLSVGTNDLSLFEKQLNIKIVPNPVSNQFSVEMDLTKPSLIDLELWDLFGKIIIKKESISKAAGHQRIGVDIQDLNLASGLYFCRVKVDKDNQVVKKVLVK